MKELLIKIFMLILATVVFTTLFIVGFLYTTFKHIIKFDYSLSKQLTPIVNSITLLLDGLANAGAGELLNDAYRIEGSIKYGKWYQSISAVTGMLFLYVKDIKLRRLLDKILGENHCVSAISDEDKLYCENIK